jgi:hypothetical protein
MHGTFAVERVPFVLRYEAVELIEVDERGLREFDEFNEFAIECVHDSALPHLVQPYDC